MKVPIPNCRLFSFFKVFERKIGIIILIKLAAHYKKFEEDDGD